MNSFKKFTDFCAGFAAFMMSIYMLGKYMAYSPDKVEGTVDKLKMFISKDNIQGYRQYLLLILFLVISLAVSMIFKRLPYVSAAVSMLPLLLTLFIFSNKRFLEYELLYLILITLHASGAIFSALSLDREDGKRRASFCTDIFGVGVVATGAALLARQAVIANFTEEQALSLGYIDTELYMGISENAKSIALKLVIMLAVGIVISLLSRDIYFISVITAAIPFGYALFVFAVDKTALFPLEAFMLTAIYLVFRLLVMLFEPMRKLS